MPGDVMNLVAQATTSPAWVDTPVLRDVPEAEVARFTDVLQPPQAPLDVPPPAPAVGAEPGHLGDAILRSMENAGREYMAKTQEIHAALTERGHEISTTTLLRLQVQLTDASMFVDLLGKAVSKATQHVDQLTKLQ